MLKNVLDFQDLLKTELIRFLGTRSNEEVLYGFLKNFIIRTCKTAPGEVLLKKDREKPVRAPHGFFMNIFDRSARGFRHQSHRRRAGRRLWCI